MKCILKLHIAAAAGDRRWGEVGWGGGCEALQRSRFAINRASQHSSTSWLLPGLQFNALLPTPTVDCSSMEEPSQVQAQPGFSTPWLIGIDRIDRIGVPSKSNWTYLWLPWHPYYACRLSIVASCFRTSVFVSVRLRQCSGRVLGVIGWDPSVCKSNRLHVDILWVSFIELGYIIL